MEMREEDLDAMVKGTSRARLFAFLRACGFSKARVTGRTGFHDLPENVLMVDTAEGASIIDIELSPAQPIHGAAGLKKSILSDAIQPLADRATARARFDKTLFEIVWDVDGGTVTVSGRNLDSITATTNFATAGDPFSVEVQDDGHSESPNYRLPLVYARDFLGRPLPEELHQKVVMEAMFGTFDSYAKEYANFTQQAAG